MTTLTKALLAQYLEQQVGLEEKQAIILIERFFGAIADALIAGNKVSLTGLGNFTLREKNARPGRNLHTQEVMMVKARRVISFQPSVQLKKQLKMLCENSES